MYETRDGRPDACVACSSLARAPARVELLAARFLERDAYRFGDSIADLSSSGALEEVSTQGDTIFTKLSWVF